LYQPIAKTLYCDLVMGA